jgi:beta-N-acetylhexosaminidase
MEPPMTARRPARRRVVIVAAVLAALVTVVGGCASDDGEDASFPQAPDDPPPPAQVESPRDDAVDPGPLRDATESLTVEQLAGELIMTKLVGSTANEAELDAVRRLGVGGIILFGPNVVDKPQLQALVASLDAARRPAAARAGLPERVLVSVDQEGGPIRNVPFAPPERTQPEVATGTPEDARREAEQAGRALRAAGVSMVLGPVADLAQGPNRTMAFRSFGEDPQRAATYVQSTVGGLQKGGVSAVAKHFPGFGASTANSDEDVAYVDRSRDELLAHELVPFRAAIAAGADSIMVSHGIHRELGSTLPGTLDPAVATELLRDELGFDGVAMTDSMNARGLREAWGDTVPRACPVAVAAGIDIVLLTGTIETARLCRERIIEAVRDGSLPEERVRDAARRVIELKLRRLERGAEAS